MLNKLTNKSIAARMIFWFLIIALVPLAIVLYLSYTISRDSLTAALRDHLIVIANNKVRQIAAFASERHKDVTALAAMPDVIRFTESLEGPEGIPPFVAIESMRPFFSTYVHTYGYDDLLLISNSGRILFCLACDDLAGSNLYDPALRSSQLGGLFDRAKTLLETEFSDFEYDERTKMAAAYIAAPIFDGGKIHGVIALRMSNRLVSNIVEDYTGLGSTGETIVATLSGTEVLFVARTRQDAGAAFRRKVQTGTEFPIVRATLGQRGDGMLTDYGGEEVMAVWRYLPYFRWGMVVKMNTGEFFAPLYDQRNVLIFFALLVALFVLWLALTVADSLSKPVVQLTQIAKTVSAGDLTAKMIETNGAQDEVSILTRGFSSMTSNLLRLISGVKQSGGEVTSSSHQIAAAARQLEATVSEQAASTNEVVATSKQISTTSHNLVQTIHDVAQEGMKTAGLVETGRSGLKEMELAMHNLVEATASISEKLQTLNEKAIGISSIVTTINRVADQTNLLSLNAAIEAEKAGEAGSGFAVVASEIRRLADQTGYATMDIEQIVQEMQTAVQAGVGGVRTFTQEVNKGVQKVQNVSRELSRIIEQVQALTPRYEQVRQGILSQSLAAEQITEAMIHLSEAAQFTAESVRSLNQITLQLNSASSHLQQEVERFKVNA